jgi:hypothetical protein
MIHVGNGRGSGMTRANKKILVRFLLRGQRDSGVAASANATPWLASAAGKASPAK